MTSSITRNQLSPPFRAFASHWNKLLTRDSNFCIWSKRHLIIRPVLGSSWCWATHGGEWTVAINGCASRVVEWIHESCWFTQAFLLQAFCTFQQDWSTTHSEHLSKTDRLVLIASHEMRCQSQKDSKWLLNSKLIAHPISILIVYSNYNVKQKYNSQKQKSTHD